MIEHLARRAGRLAGRAWRASERRPLIVVPAVVTLGLVGSLAPDLWMMMPWPVRRTIGMTAFVGLIALGGARLMWVRPGDRWESSEGEGEGKGKRGGRGPVERLLPWILAGATASLAWPLLQRPGLGHGDWDFYLQTYESVRISVLDHGQFPWWNPWSRGGFPLAADPQCSLVPLATPLVLALGTGPGLRLAAVLCLMIAVEGARRLARLWVGDPWAACAAGLVFGLHGGIIVYTVAGLFVPMTFCAMPWLILHTCRLANRTAEGVALGAWAAFNVLSGISYPTIYGFLIAGAFAVRGLRVERGERRRRFARHGLLAVGLMLVLSGWRIGPMMAVLADFPRVGGMMIDLRPLAFLEQMLYRPTVDDLRTISLPIFWGSNCAIGIIGVALLGASLAGGWRWWHWLALIGFALALGAVRLVHPSFWLSYWPVFKTMHMVTRWRVAAMLGVGLAVADAVARMRRSGRPGFGPAAAVLVLGMGAELIAYGHRALPVAPGPRPEEAAFPGPAIDRPIQLEAGPAYPNTLRGYGTVRSIQPILGYDTGLPTARRWPGHPDYRGEFVADGRPVEPESWSPNRILLRVEPHQLVEVNQNPGSWWRVNGRRAFPDLRCAEWDRPFFVRADDRGVLDLRIAPAGLRRGLALQGIGAILVAGAVVIRRGAGSARTGEGGGG